jgi:hypothetical protein
MSLDVLVGVVGIFVSTLVFIAGMLLFKGIGEREGE